MKARAAVAATIIVASLALVPGARASWGNGAQIVSASAKTSSPATSPIEKPVVVATLPGRTAQARTS